MESLPRRRQCWKVVGRPVNSNDREGRTKEESPPRRTPRTKPTGYINGEIGVGRTNQPYDESRGMADDTSIARTFNTEISSTRGAREPGARSQEPGVRSPEPGARRPKHGARSPELAVHIGRLVVTW